MLKIGIYLNVFVILGLSIAALVLTFRKKSDLKKIALLAMAFTTLNFFNFVLLSMEIVETNWDLLILFPVCLLTGVMNMVTTIVSFVKMIKAGRCTKVIFDFLATPVLAVLLLFFIPFGYNVLIVAVLVIVAEILLCKTIKKSEEKDKLGILKIALPIILPVLIVGIPFAYEAYIIKNCEYILTYNYQNGWTTSEDTYIAVINKKPVEVTLHKNLFNREEVEIDFDYCILEDLSAAENDRTEEIIADIKERCPGVDSVIVEYFADGNAIVTIEKEGRCVAEYFYYDNEFIKDISDFNFVGDLEEVIYYKLTYQNTK